MNDILAEIADAVIGGEFKDVVVLTHEALAAGLQADQILNHGLMHGMDYVGVEFRSGSMFVPEVLRSARAMQASMDVIRPLLVREGVPMRGRVLIGTVKGDMHDIGKNLVKMMFEGAGFEVVDLGKDVAPDGFVTAVQELRPQIVGMSALLTTTMGAMATTVSALKDAGLRDEIKVLIGGAPVTQAFATQIGADGYASNAASAVDVARRLLAPAA